MIQSIRAVFRGGVLRPLDPLRLQEDAEVRLTVDDATSPEALPKYDDPLEGIEMHTGIPDLAEHFDDHRFGRGGQGGRRGATNPEDDPLKDIRFDGPPDLAEHFDDYRFGRRQP